MKTIKSSAVFTFCLAMLVLSSCTPKLEGKYEGEFWFPDNPSATSAIDATFTRDKKKVTGESEILTLAAKMEGTIEDDTYTYTGTANGDFGDFTLEGSADILDGGDSIEGVITVIEIPADVHYRMDKVSE